MNWGVMQGHASTAKRGFIALSMALSLAAVFASGAGAVLVHVHHGRVAGVLPLRWIHPTSIPGHFAKPKATSARKTSSQSSNAAPADTGSLSYHGGTVLHAETPYLIFWDPSGTAITAGEKANLEQYFADAAVDNGTSSNIFGVDRQFTDTTGFADYNQTWSSAQAISDTQAYPSTGQCTENAGFAETTCLTDSQIQAEVQRLINVDGLPTGTSGSAPIYFVVTPPRINTCMDGTMTCADNYYCAYHSSFTGSGIGSPDILYANMPMLLAANDPKSCQSDASPAVQKPNGNPITDVVISSMSHEFSETITDPVNGGGWNDPLSGNEDGDNCAFYGAQDPANGYSPDAFGPTLGGSAAARTLYDQLINGHPYYTQTEWSNGNTACEAKPAGNTLSPAFTAPAKVLPGNPVILDPSSSMSPAGFSSATWTFGDGSSSFTRSPPATQSHTFASPGTDTVTLNTVDTYGNVASVSHVVEVTNAIAAFSSSPGVATTNSAVQFDGSSSATTGASPSYAWSADDGWTSTDVTPTHAFATAGTHAVTLTISNGTDQDSITHYVKVDAPPISNFAVTTAHPRTTYPVAFDGSSSTESGGSIATYQWDFGDDTTGSGSTPAHTYTTAGTYTVSLIVTDQDGNTSTPVARQVTVASSPTASFTTSPAAPVAGSSVSFDGSSSGEPGGSISSYSWSFGDGQTGAGVNPTHVYASSGTYSVVLTITDANGQTAQATEALTVAAKPAVAPVRGVPTALIAVKASPAVAAVSVRFSGAGSSARGSSLIGYSWSFGDGATAAGIAPNHRYRRPGTYSVSLTVRDATGATAAMTRTVRVLAGSITGVSITTGKKLEQIRFTISGPGTLSVGGHNYEMGRPRTFTYRLKLSPAQAARVRGRHRVKIRLSARFRPTTGARSRRAVTFTINP